MRLHFCKIDLFFVEKYTRECCLWVCIAVKRFFCLTSYNFFWLDGDNKIQKSICKVTQDKNVYLFLQYFTSDNSAIMFFKAGIYSLETNWSSAYSCTAPSSRCSEKKKIFKSEDHKSRFFWHSRRANRCEHNHTFYFHSLKAVRLRHLYEIFRMGCFII